MNSMRLTPSDPTACSSPEFYSFKDYYVKLPNQMATAIKASVFITGIIGVAFAVLYGNFSSRMCLYICRKMGLSAALTLIDSAAKPIFNRMFQEHNIVRNIAHYVAAPLILGAITRIAGVPFWVLGNTIVNGVCTVIEHGGQHPKDRAVVWVDFSPL